MLRAAAIGVVGIVLKLSRCLKSRVEVWGLLSLQGRVHTYVLDNVLQGIRQQKGWIRSPHHPSMLLVRCEWQHKEV